MTSRISHTTFDALDSYAQSAWWKDVLGYTDVPGDPNEPGHEECMIIAPDSGEPRPPESRGSLLFVQVPDGKQLKNRLHLDLRPIDGSRDEEVERLLELGATLVADRRVESGGGWVVLADPEGNEFDILRSDRELTEQT